MDLITYPWSNLSLRRIVKYTQDVLMSNMQNAVNSAKMVDKIEIYATIFFDGSEELWLF